MRKCKFIPIMLCFPLLAGCSVSPKAPDPDKLSIVCTVFPQYDWAREIIGDADNIDLILLDDSGTDFHSYQPGTDDMVTISSCDILIYVGGESDRWIDDALKNAVNPDMQIISLTEIMGTSLLDEPLAEEEHDHDHEHSEEEQSFDEHVWLSLKNAELFCGTISDALCIADPENADSYRANAEAYISKLTLLDESFEKSVQSAERNTVLFADRFPFVYLMEDYGLTYYAAFPGCSAETDASFETVVALANEADANQLTSILTIDGSDSNIAEAVISNTQNKNQKVLALDSMQSVSRQDIDGGYNYLSVMENNLNVLTEALN